jgi:hypothetical protein
MNTCAKKVGGYPSVQIGTTVHAEATDANADSTARAGRASGYNQCSSTETFGDEISLG